MLDKSQPLWLPKGSVRAILAIVLVGAGVVAAFALPGVPEWFPPLVAMVVTAYFVQRASASQA